MEEYTFTYYDVDGTAYEVEDDTVYEDVWVDGWESYPYEYVLADVNGEEHMVIIWVGETTFDCPEGTAPGWFNSDGEPTSCVDNNPVIVEEPEPIETQVVPEVVEVVVDEPIVIDESELVDVEYEAVVEVPEAQEQPMLAETGTTEVITGAILGVALVVAGVITMMKGRRVA